MLENRYEEYVSFSDKLPFIFSPRLTRSREIHIHEANWHENIEIQFCDSGSGTVLLDGTAFSVCRGDAVIVNSNVIHHTGSSEQIVYSCLIIDQQFCLDADIDPSSIRFQSLIRDERISNIFAEIYKTYSSSLVCRVARLRSLTLSLLIILREEYSTEQSRDKVTDSAHKNVKNAINYIRKHYSEKISLDGISKSIFVDKYVLSRQFKKIIGQTLVEYINSYRIKQASILLREGHTASETAWMCGFNNQSFFCKTFKKYTGFSPIEFKNK